MAQGVGGIGVGRHPGELRRGDARGAVDRAAARVGRRRPVGVGVVVQHAHGRLAASEGGPSGVSEKDGELLVSLSRAISDDGDENAPLGLARGECHPPIAPAVVAGTHGRPVLGDVVDGDRPGPGLREPERDAGSGEALVPFGDDGILDVEARRGLGEQRHPHGVRGRELPVVAGEAQLVDADHGEGRRGRGTRRLCERDGTGTAEEAPGNARRREEPPVVRDRALERGGPLRQGDRQVGPGVDVGGRVRGLNDNLHLVERRQLPVARGEHQHVFPRLGEGHVGVFRGRGRERDVAGALDLAPGRFDVVVR